jgi:hypothetical protein
LWIFDRYPGNIICYFLKVLYIAGIINAIVVLIIPKNLGRRGQMVI